MPDVERDKPRREEITRYFRRALAAIALAGIGAVSISAPAMAECPYIPPYPAVTEAATSAREIIVGTVLENDNAQIYDFRLHVDHVLRGSSTAGEVRAFKSLYPKWPIDTTAEGTLIAPCEPITASPGNVIALALDALAPDGETRYNAVAWITGTPEYRNEPGQFEVTTLSTLVTLSGAPPATDTVPGGSDQAQSRSIRVVDVAIVAMGVAAALFLLRRLNRQPSRAKPLW